ncbi:hypothetical protein [Micromonospora sp. WMMD980]|uniref:hypothetical protein n=1 Tax=Micromonospora sp. WMMD980 TaxID=3016088 RepID=UPI0024174228|nr:hypothetical protein [Micromonospora sp. WMMD980]MDG4803221.1 hypothetical protein [Micromonospora sp. WMMD980]
MLVPVEGGQPGKRADAAMIGSRRTSRVVAQTDLAGLDAGRLMDLMAAMVSILTIPAVASDHADALAVPVGQGEQSRLKAAIDKWERNDAARRLLITNGNPAERTYREITLEYLHELGLRRLDGVHVQREPAPNTAIQAAWIVDRVEEFDVEVVGVAVAAYHLPRVYLTVLKEFVKRGKLLPLVPLPVPLAPTSPSPETGMSQFDLVPGEALRMLRYVDLGWVASPEELRAYLDWLWRHHRALLR